MTPPGPREITAKSGFSRRDGSAWAPNMFSCPSMTAWRLSCVVAAGSVGVVLAGCPSSDDAAGNLSNEGGLTTLGADGSNGSSSGSSGTSGSSGLTSSGSSGKPGGDAGPDGDPGDFPCSGSAADPAAAVTINGYIDTLPNQKPSGTVRDAIVDAVIKSCAAYGPPLSNPGWAQEYCWAHLVAAMSKESAYNVDLSIRDSYGSRAIGAQTANDPTVGLLQVRFSSTVHDMEQQGNTDSLTCIGCTFPAGFAAHRTKAGDSPFWAVTGPPANAALMKQVECNVGLGTWYYYLNATANGNPAAVTYLQSYCAGGGTAGNLVTGLLSHYAGPSGGKGFIANMAGVNALQASNNGAYQYITLTKTLFDAMIGPVAGTHPFFIKLVPSSAQYCR